MTAHQFNKIATYRSPAELRARLLELNIELPCDDEIQTTAGGSPLAAPIQIGDFQVGNR